LSQLREWEIDPQKTGIFYDQEDSEEVQYQDYVDLTQIDNCVDLTAEELNLAGTITSFNIFVRKKY
jgi:hypothetical protein